MTDEFDPLRELRPDRVRPEHPGDPGVFEREKERLMSIIEETDPQVSTSGRIPGIYPRLAYRDERAALDYLTRVFGLVEIREARMESEDSFLAWLRLDRGLVMIGRANADVHRIISPLDLGATTAMMNVDVHDIDAHYARAVAEGADITMELEDAFYGSRRYEATDLEGHRWHFSESFASIRARGGTVPDDA